MQFRNQSFSTTLLPLAHLSLVCQSIKRKFILKIAVKVDVHVCSPIVQCCAAGRVKLHLEHVVLRATHYQEAARSALMIHSITLSIAVENVRGFFFGVLD